MSSSSNQKKIIAVTTATGTQGWGVIQELLKEGSFAIRGLTRNPAGAKARELTAQGVEMVKADLEDVDSLIAAFSGAYGVYGNTDFWGLLVQHNFNQQETKEHEKQHGKNLVDAAKTAGVQHFVWSTLDHIDGLNVFHFDSKAEIDPYLAASGIPYYTLFYTSCYYSNLVMPTIEFLKKDKEGNFYVDIPIATDTPVHYFDGAEVGLWVVPILLDGPKYNGKRVDAVSELMSTRDFAKTITRVTGIPVAVKEVTVEEFLTPEYRASVFDEMWLNSALWVKGGLTRDFEQSNAIARSRPSTFEEFLKRDKMTRDYLGLTAA